MKDFKWLREINDLDEILDGDIKLIYEWCGLDVLIALLNNFSSMSLYISTRNLQNAKKRYILKHYKSMKIKELCSILDVSERFVYEAISEKNEAK